MGNTYFISDLHLGATYDGGTREREKRVVRFLESIRADAERLYLVGDILDYWYEYRTVVPRGYVRFFGALAALADAGVKITWFIGNHDIWLFDYIRDEIGVEIVDGFRIDEIDGRKFYITHGDAVGSLKPGFKFIRAMFRNRFCQWLYAGIHPRWTIPFAHRWSTHSRRHDYAPGFDAATDPLVKFAEAMHANDPSIVYFVFGHRHVMLDREIAPGCRVIILGDWLNHDSYAVYSDGKMSLKTFTLPPQNSENA